MATSSDRALIQEAEELQRHISGIIASQARWEEPSYLVLKQEFQDTDRCQVHSASCSQSSGKGNKMRKRAGKRDATSKSPERSKTGGRNSTRPQRPNETWAWVFPTSGRKGCNRQLHGEPIKTVIHKVQVTRSSHSVIQDWRRLVLFCGRFQRHHESGRIKAISPASLSHRGHSRRSQAFAVPAGGGQCRACTRNPNRAVWTT